MAILSEQRKTNKFESHNSLKLNFTNIWGLLSNFAECEYLLESKPSDILAPWDTNLDDLIDSGNLSLEDYFTLVWKDSVTHMLGLAVYVKEHLPFVWDVPLENSADSYLFLTDFTSHSV